MLLLVRICPGQGRMEWQRQRRLWLVLLLPGPWGCGLRREPQVGDCHGISRVCTVAAIWFVGSAVGAARVAAIGGAGDAAAGEDWPGPGAYGVAEAAAAVAGAAPAWTMGVRPKERSQGEWWQVAG
jgi:hypothetical protein